MREIAGSTAEEVRMFKAIQRATGAMDNGIIGCDTMSCLAEKVNADCFPIALQIYGCPAVIAKSLIPFNPEGPIKDYEYSMSGSFTWPSGAQPCSILVNRNEILQEYACHYWADGKPESVMYQSEDGSFGIRRVMSIAQLPSKILWAVGGMGLMQNFDPIAEGFVGINAGVLRTCGHNILGYKNGHVYGVAMNSIGYSSSQLSGLYSLSNSSKQEDIERVRKNLKPYPVNTICKDKFEFEGAIQLDGGSVFFYNFKDMKRGVNTMCGYAIQFTKG